MQPQAQRFPRTATNIIAALTAIATVIVWLTDSSPALPAGRAEYALAFIPGRWAGLSLPFSAVPAVLTPLTATLVHANLIHLGFNLLMLVWCGIQVERVLGVTGLVVLYLVGAYGAAGAEWLALLPRPANDIAWMQPIVGASGAISAVVGAFALSFGRAKAFTNNLRLNRWINIAWLMVAWIVLQLMMGWFGGLRGYLLATPAHVGGFAAGLLLQRPLLLWRYRKA